jgi:hypothetical protein
MSRLRSFWEWVDRNGVSATWIAAYYVPLLGFALAAAVFIPTHLDNPVVGDLPIHLWVWVQLVAIPAAIGGLLLRHGGPADGMSTWQLRSDWFGLCLQASGHASMCLMLTEFERALIKFLTSGALPITDLIWWLLAFAVAAISSYVFGTALLTVQCLRKIHKALRLQARI